MTTLQQINANPDLIFSTQNAVLREELATQPTAELKNFLRTLANDDWFRKLDESKRLDVFMKVQCVVPAEAVTEFEALDHFFKTISPYQPSKTPKDFLQLLYRENRSFCYAMVFRLRGRHEEQLQDNPTKNLVLFDYACNYFASESSFLLDEEISLSAKIADRDLLDIGCKYELSPSLLLKILEVYRKRLPKDEYKALLQARGPKVFEDISGNGLKTAYLLSAYKEIGLEPPFLSTDGLLNTKFPWANTPSEWKELFKYLSDHTKRSILQKYPFYFIIQFGLSDDPAYFDELFLKLHALGLGAQAYSLGTEPGGQSYLENFFLMLGRQDSAKRLSLARQPNTNVKTSETDTLYRTFDRQKIREQLEFSYENLMAELRFHTGDLSIWTRQEFLKKAHEFMELAFLETIFLFRDAWEKSGHDSNVMGRLLSDQKRDGPRYIKHYFYGSFVEFYRFSQSKAIFAEKGNNLTFPSLSFKDEDPFFDPLQLQYHWRVMYTAIGSLLRFYQFDEHFDSRYWHWTPWHLEREINKDEIKPIPIYGTRPTV